MGLGIHRRRELGPHPHRAPLLRPRGLRSGVGAAPPELHLRALPDARWPRWRCSSTTPVGARRALERGAQLPPGLRDPGRVGLLPSASGAPLRASATSRYENHDVDLRAGSTVVLYTDGLVVRRGECSTRVRCASRGGGGPRRRSRRLARRLSTALIGADVPTRRHGGADVCTYAVGRSRARPPRPTRRVDAGRVRAAPLAPRVGATEQETAEIVLAANEAVGNAVVHAYGLTEGEVLLSARLGLRGPNRGGGDPYDRPAAPGRPGVGGRRARQRPLASAGPARLERRTVAPHDPRGDGPRRGGPRRPPRSRGHHGGDAAPPGRRERDAVSATP